MPYIQKQLIPVQMGAGLNTKIDPKQLHAGQLRDLQNGQFSKTSQINKRYGYDILNQTIEGGGTISAGIALAVLNNELIVLDGQNIYTYIPATGNWANRGTAISVTTQDKNIIHLINAQQINPDMGYANGILAFAYEDTRGGIRYSILDNTSNAFVIFDHPISSGTQQPKCISFNGLIYIFSSDGGNNLYYTTINPLNPANLPTQINIINDGFAGLNGFPYDVAVIDNKIYIAYLSSNPITGAIKFFSLDVNNNLSSVTIVNNTHGQAINAGFHGAVNVVGASKDNIWISWASGFAIYTAAYTAATNPPTNILPTTLVDVADVRVITGIESLTTGILQLHYEVYATPGYNEQVRFCTITTAGVIGNVNEMGNVNIIRSVGIASKAFNYAGNIYLNTAYASTLQATDFLFLMSTASTTATNNGLLTNPIIIAKFDPGTSGGLQTNGMCPETANISSGQFKFANNSAGKIISEANTIFTLKGITASSINFTPSDNFETVVQNNTLLIVGGILQVYDSNTTNELGFHLFPENVTAIAQGSGGNLSAGTYQYIVEFHWTDTNGLIYRSAPCVPISVATVANDSVILSGPTLRLTSKTTPISICIYRTQVNGSAAGGATFNQITNTISGGTSNQPLTNNTQQDNWTFTDLLSDSVMANNELEYTAGGVLSNIPPPANSIITTYNNRAVVSGMSDPLLLWYSQSVIDNSNLNTVPTQFCAELTVSLDPRGGPITALGVLNQTLIIFKYNNIFSLQGNGPSATGNNNDYGDPVLVTSDVGCINVNSVVIVPNGLMFQSVKGIYLIDQALNLSYIGSPVEDFNSLTITSAVLNTTNNQVIFTTSNGLALVFDYFHQQWSTWTNHYVADSIIYNNVFTYLTASGQVYVQNSSKFTDGSSPIYLSFTLPDLAFAGLQGYQSVFKFFILGTFKSPHSLLVNIAYDYRDNYTQTDIVTPQPMSLPWGGAGHWGDETFWGGTYQLYMFRVDLNIQKCTAIRLNITDTQSGVYGEGYAISSIVFEVGIMPGGNRLNSPNVSGTK